MAADAIGERTKPGAAVSPPWPEVAELLLRGGLTLGFAVVALLLQALAVLVPGVASALLLLVFAVFAAVGGAAALSFLWLGSPAGARRAGLVLRAALGVGVAVATFAGPIVAGQPWTRLALLLAAWAVLNGFLDVAGGAGLLGTVPHRWLMAIGASSVCVGMVLLVWAPSGMLPLVWWITGYGVIYGGVSLVNAWRVEW